MNARTRRDMHRWTKAEEDELRWVWGAKTVATIAAQLDRTQRAVVTKARRLGLGIGVPNGWEYLTAAAQRAGYEVVQLRRILAFANVRIRPSASMAKTGRYSVVDPDAVDRAVALWLSTETITEAARSRGLSRASLEKVVRARLPSPPKNTVWRIPTAFFDEVAPLTRKAGQRWP